MEKIRFVLEETGQPEDFFVLEETIIGGTSYILVTDSEQGDAECMILKDTNNGEDEDRIFEVVQDDGELQAVLKVFEQLLEEVEIEM